MEEGEGWGRGGRHTHAHTHQVFYYIDTCVSVSFLYFRLSAFRCILLLSTAMAFTSADGCLDQVKIDYLGSEIPLVIPRNWCFIVGFLFGSERQK